MLNYVEEKLLEHTDLSEIEIANTTNDLIDSFVEEEHERLN